MRGPGTQPLSIARINATSLKSGAPTSRTVVNPAINVSLAFFAPLRADSAVVSLTEAFSQPGYMSLVKCV